MKWCGDCPDVAGCYNGGLCGKVEKELVAAMEWREGECMHWECSEDSTVTCRRCEQAYCEKHRDHFCCAGHDEWNMTCMCENEYAEE